MDRSKIISKTMSKLSLKSIDFINEVDKPDKMKPKEKKKMNEEFRKQGLDGNGRFKKIDQGINKINEILSDNGFELDEVTGSDRFQGDKGRQEFHIARKNKKDPHSPVEIKNSLIVFTWHLLHEKNVTDTVKDKTFEILAYVS
jgi:hypothetical protein